MGAEFIADIRGQQGPTGPSMDMGTILDGTNLNTIIEPGSYTLGTQGTYPNAPVPLPGSLFVQRVQTLNIQEFTTWEINPRVFVRRRTGSSTWDGWENQSLDMGTVLDGTDLNTIYGPGTYTLGTQGTYPNAPAQVPGSLFVRRVQTLNIQEVTTWERTPRRFVRRRSGTNTWDPWSSQDAAPFQAWRNAVQSISSRPIRALVVGDSISEGTGVTGLTQTWPHQFGIQMRAALASLQPGMKNPVGWVPIVGSSKTLDLPWTMAGTWIPDGTFNFRRGPSARLYSGATITGTVTGTSIDVWFASGPTTTKFTVSVDGGAPVSVGVAGGGLTPGQKVRVSLGASGVHTVMITSTGDCFIGGISVYDGNENAGLQITNGGHHGWTSGNWAGTTGVGNWTADVATLNPDVVFIMIGANDYTSSAGRTFGDNIRTIVTNIRTVASATIVLVATYKRSETASPSWEFYTDSIRGVADDYGTGFIDLREHMPDAGTPEGNASGYYYDTVHPTAAGMERIASLVNSYMLARS